MTDVCDYRNVIQKHAKSNPDDAFVLGSEGQEYELARQATHAIVVVDCKQQREHLGQQMGIATVMAFLGQMGVAEAYSPPRVAAMATRMELREGWSLDSTICGIDGREQGFQCDDGETFRGKNCLHRQTVGNCCGHHVRTTRHDELHKLRPGGSDRGRAKQGVR